MDNINWNDHTPHQVFNSDAYDSCGPMDAIGNKIIYAANIPNRSTPAPLNIYDLAEGKDVFSSKVILDQQIVKISRTSNCAYYASEGKMWALNLDTFVKKVVWHDSSYFYVTDAPRGRLIMWSRGDVKVFSIKPDGSIDLIDTVPANLPMPPHWECGLTLSFDGNFVASSQGHEKSGVSIVDLTTKKKTSFEIL